MNERSTVLVTGVGAVIGYGIIRSLRRSRFNPRIIGMDIYPDAVGGAWCDHFERALRADDPGYVDFLLELARRHDIDLVIPGIEQDCRRICREATALDNGRLRLALNAPRLIELAADKWLFREEMIRLGFPAIASRISGSFDQAAEELGLPMLLKPRRSYASKGIQRIGTARDFDYWQEKLGDNFMVQEIVGQEDEEYTVAAFGFGDGQASAPIVLRRVLSGEGATAKAAVTREPDIEAAVSDYTRALTPIGPTNFQFRRHRGLPMLLEINPRVSSSTSLRTAFGFNEAEMCLDFYVHGNRPPSPRIRPGRATRYIEDHVVYDSQDDGHGRGR